ncbi:MAG TPA: helix-turn-helix domain-containing protein [Terriglobia bacterium]|nr:helix-turn-helix domain-containing protein [Terriglobia bacterium]
MNIRSNRIELEKLKDKAYRDSYVREHIRIGLPYQVRALRQQRHWKQEELGERSGKPQNVISRLEDPSYGKLSLQSMIDLASAFDVALLIKFVPFSRFLREFQNLSPEALEAVSFDQDVEELGGAIDEVLGQKISGSDSPRNRSPLHLVPLEKSNGLEFEHALSGTTKEKMGTVIPWPAPVERRSREYAAISGNAR